MAELYLHLAQQISVILWWNRDIAVRDLYLRCCSSPSRDLPCNLQMTRGKQVFIKKKKKKKKTLLGYCFPYTWKVFFLNDFATYQYLSVQIFVVITGNSLWLVCVHTGHIRTVCRIAPHGRWDAWRWQFAERRYPCRAGLYGHRVSQLC
jgi:hypothetical protein